MGVTLQTWRQSWALIPPRPAMRTMKPDVSALEWARLSFAPRQRAHDCALQAADHHTARRGGEGAVREICDAILLQRAGAQ